MILNDTTTPRGDFEAETGWKLTAAGACKGTVCVPLADPTAAAQEVVNAIELAEAIGLPVAHNNEHGIWAVGPESIGARALVTAEDAEFELPDLDGNLFRLSSLRGQKVLVYAWAPY